MRSQSWSLGDRRPVADACQRPGHQAEGKIVEELRAERRSQSRKPSAKGLQQVGKTLLRRLLEEIAPPEREVPADELVRLVEQVVPNLAGWNLLGIHPGEQGPEHLPVEVADRASADVVQESARALPALLLVAAVVEEGVERPPIGDGPPRLVAGDPEEQVGELRHRLAERQRPENEAGNDLIGIRAPRRFEDPAKRRGQLGDREGTQRVFGQASGLEFRILIVDPVQEPRPFSAGEKSWMSP